MMEFEIKSIFLIPLETLKTTHEKESEYEEIIFIKS
jgi:hypothetical protein